MVQKIMKTVMGSTIRANVPDRSCMLGRDGCIAVRNKSSPGRHCKWLGEKDRVIEDGLKCIHEVYSLPVHLQPCFGTFETNTNRMSKTLHRDYPDFTGPKCSLFNILWESNELID